MRHSQFKPGRLVPVLVAMAILTTAADVLVRAGPQVTRLSHAVLAAFPARRTGFAPGDSLTTTTHGGTTGSRRRDDRRASVLRRLTEAGQGTYLPAMLAQVDSAIRRWPDDRFQRPLRVGFTRADVPGFRDDFAGALALAVARWNAVALPLQLDFRGADTSRADVTVAWVKTLDSGRTGKADVTWDQRQQIRRVAVALATHTPDGRALTVPEMTALSLHELGHAVGLAHSADPSDALYPMTRATELSARDRATARLLYELPTGSLRR